MSVIPQRMTAVLDKPMVVFLIGMRINRWWKVHKWWPVASAMGKMIQELRQHPELGFYSAEMWSGRTTIMVQYWRSFEALEAYAKSPQHAHLPAWAAFRRAIGNNGDVGVWHETYVVTPAGTETFYHNMPEFGLGKVVGLVEASGDYEQAQGRLNKN